MHFVITFILLAFSFSVRSRFRNHHPLFLFLQYPRNTLFFFSPLFMIYIISVFCYFQPESNPNKYLLATSLIVIPAVSIYLTFMNLKSKEARLLLTTFKNLRIDIQPSYIPDTLSGDEYTNTIMKFIDNIVTLQQLPFHKIYFSSHLITPFMKKELKRKLRERKIPCYAKYHKICCLEVVLLNVRYGGLTRYRLLSHKRHANGFRVRRSGYTFTLRKKRSLNRHSASPAE